MRIRAGYEIVYDCVGPTPMLLVLNVHPSREPDLLSPDSIRFDQPVPVDRYTDLFGNTCHRILAPEGRITISNDFMVQDSGVADEQPPHRPQLPVEALPPETLVFLLGSRYCETDRLSDTAWALFGHLQGGRARVEAICGYVHQHLTFGYEFARSTRTAWDAYVERQGVCRDFAHLAVALCRCMNIPARYCTGYLGDIGVPPGDTPMDFSGWFDAFLDGRWYTFDARHNHPRIGRILMARGRDAADVAIATTFGACTLSGFSVITDEIPS